jgi:hypothetical protein
MRQNQNLLRSIGLRGLDRAVILAGHLTEFTPAIPALTGRHDCG